MPLPDLKEEEIRARAREIWKRAGEPEGFAADHWLEAKWQLIGEKGNTAPPAPAPTEPSDTAEDEAVEEP